MNYMLNYTIDGDAIQSEKRGDYDFLLLQRCTTSMCGGLAGSDGAASGFSKGVDVGGACSPLVFQGGDAGGTCIHGF
jgi:hypothetical protein